MSKEIATTILAQLGGNKFLAMTGAKNLVSYKEGALSMRIPKIPGVKANYLKVTLNDADLYDMEFKRIHGMKVTDVETVNNVYADQLQEIFTSVTGLDTHL